MLLGGLGRKNDPVNLWLDHNLTIVVFDWGYHIDTAFYASLKFGHSTSGCPRSMRSIRLKSCEYLKLVVYYPL